MDGRTNGNNKAVCLLFITSKISDRLGDSGKDQVESADLLLRKFILFLNAEGSSKINLLDLAPVSCCPSTASDHSEVLTEN